MAMGAYAGKMEGNTSSVSMATDVRERKRMVFLKNGLKNFYHIYFLRLQNY